MPNSVQRRYGVCIAFFLLFSCLVLKAQDSLSLKECISYALEHNTQVQRTKLSLDQANNNYLRSQAATLPSLNGNAAQNYNFGRTIDPYSNQFVDQRSRSNSFSLSSDVVLFNGFQKVNEIRQNSAFREASRNNLQKSKDDISLAVANAYLQVIQLSERRKQLQNQVSNSTAQHQKTQALYDNGAAARSKMLEIEAQLANDEALLADMDYQVGKAYQQLKVTMNYDPAKPLKAAAFPLLTFPEYVESDLDKALKDRVNDLPAVQSARNTEESYLYGLKSARGGLSPRLSLGGSLHTVYSSLAEKATFNSKIQQVAFTQDSVPVYSYVTAPSYSPLGFSEQLRNNYGQSVGFALSVPIFNGLQNRYSVQNALINMKMGQLALNDAQVSARNDVYNSFQNMQLSKKKYQAADAQLKAQQGLYKDAELRYNNGILSYFDWNNVRTSYSNAQSQFLQAEYDYLFQIKVFEYYSGKGI